jgi:hypothetical protein
MDAHRLVALQFVNRITKKKKPKGKQRGTCWGVGDLFNFDI